MPVILDFIYTYNLISLQLHNTNYIRRQQTRVECSYLKVLIILLASRVETEIPTLRNYAEKERNLLKLKECIKYLLANKNEYTSQL